MNILFIYSVNDIYSPARPLRTEGQMQFGISYISSCLKQNGHKTKLLILSRMIGKRNKHAVDKYISNFSPKLICFTAVSTEYPFIAKTAAYIKEAYPGIALLIGGPHVSLNPEGILSNSFDALCIGEGEQPTLELTEQLSKGVLASSIANLWLKRGCKVERNAARPFLQQIDALPFPDRAIWQDWIMEPEAETPVLLGRGCPFQCTYCCNHALRKLSTGAYVRFRSPDNICAEIENIANQYPGRNNFYLEVETVAANRDWALRLCSRLKGLNSKLKRPLTYSTNLRITPNTDFSPLFAAFRESNFRTINIGVESGSERVRREILKRDYSNQDIVNAVELAEGHGLKVNFYNLIGIPGETTEDFKETVKINRRCLPDKTFNHIFFPYPGTELHSLCETQGLLSGAIDTDLERCKAVLDMPQFRKKQIRRSFIWFDYHVYRGHRPLRSILKKVLVSYLMSNTCLHYIYRHITYFTHRRRYTSAPKAQDS